MRAELFDAVKNVKQPRHAGGNRRSQRQIFQPQRAAARIPLEQNPDDDTHLQYGRALADEVRAHDDFSDSDLDDNHADQYQKIAPDDYAREPERNLAEKISVIKT